MESIKMPHAAVCEITSYTINNTFADFRHYEWIAHWTFTYIPVLVSFL